MAWKQLVRSKLYRLTEPVPLRLLVLRLLDRRFDLLSYKAKIRIGSLDRAHYAAPLYHAALLARRLGHTEVSAIEFGVAGGNGLVALEQHAKRIERETGVQIATFGFDAGSGLPPPLDYRDVPYMWQGGFYQMDVERLSARLERSKLIVGQVQETLGDFFETHKPPPIGFISFDLDYYSSTAAALKIFESDKTNFLPRVICYFDDIVGDIDAALNDFTGELLAIREFNLTNETTKISQVQGLRFHGLRIPQLWHEQIYVAHFFDHDEYCRWMGSVPTDQPLDQAIGQTT